jgi:hypothetical protein
MSVLFDAPWALVGIALIASGLWAVRQRWRALPKAERLAVLGRAGALALICLALAGPRLSSGASERFVYFLVDRSASVGTELSKLSQLVQALAQPTERTFYGLISFGAEPMIETGFAPTLSGFQTEPDPTATDIAQAIQLALETFPRRGRREIVLFTDGQATKGDLAVVVARARREGVPIHIWPLGGDLSEVWISDLELPEEVPWECPSPSVCSSAPLRRGRAPCSSTETMSSFTQRPSSTPQGFKKSACTILSRRRGLLRIESI